jgi:hypothetical protein
MYSTCIVILILNITIHRKHLPLILRRISIVDSKLFTEGSSEKIYKTRRLETTKGLLLIVFIHIIKFLFNIYYLFKLGILYKMFLILRNVCEIIFFSITFQYISLVLVLKARYKHLASTFSNLLVTKDNLSDKDLTHVRHPGHSGGCFILYANARCLEACHIRKLRNIYSQLHDVLCLVNKYYGFKILLVIISIIVNFIPTFYSLIVYIQNFILHQRELANYIYIASQIFWLMSIFFMFVWLISCCQMVTGEIYKLLLCSHKILIYSNVMQSTIIELKCFISQLKDLRVEFSVYGLFTLNLPFLCATLGVITTYVTLLFQLN